MEGAWQYSAWETAQRAGPDSKLLLFSRCWSTRGTEGRLLPARSGKVASLHDRRVRGSNGLKERTITKQQQKCTESWYYWMKLRAEKFKHRGTACPWNMCGYIPRKAVETWAWCVSKARLEQKAHLYQSSSYQLGRAERSEPEFTHLLQPQPNLQCGCILTPRKVSQSASPNLPWVSPCVLL